MSMSAAERKQIADELGLSEQYLYQCMSGRASMDPKEAVRVEEESGKRLRRWHLRTADWHLIWPELVKTKGAPAIPEAKAEA